ncbi:MAG: hypothetical protein A3I66_14310 [Burkholderiales bacterium RIFCSPLOWO2_02_FULL_57_36]|nr:MAG: hypothetical protein A3I66_14310 [Burkholderiales bacterium RIFCSPLOWO2_02_FULL_57_36]
MADQSKDFLTKLYATFRIEAQEHLQEIVSTIVLLEQQSGNARKDLVERLLKRLHTLKGAARAVNLVDLEALCHAMESIFSAMGKSNRVLASEQFDLLHQAGSVAQALLHEPTGRTRNQASALIASLDRLTAELTDTGHGADRNPDAEPVSTDADDIAEGAHVSSQAPDATQQDVIRVHGKSLDAIRYQAEALLSIDLSLQHHLNDLMALADDIADHHDRIGMTARDSGGAIRRGKAGPARRAISDGLAAPREDDESAGGIAGASRYNSQFELRCRRLAGTLSRTRRDFTMLRSRLMDATLATALVPFSSALEQLPGLVRNLARSQAKEVLLSVEGEGVQIDRRVLHIIRETLIHLVTNAVDHGIEPIAKRLANGKQRAGVVRVTVAQCGGNRVSVTVADDGAGIDLAGVEASAARSSDLHAGQIAALSDQQKLQLALHAGVSTSLEVTQVSGRGVGLAIVAEKVASVGGELQIDNSAGAGCAFRLMLPVRLATLRALVLRTGSSRYVFPLAGIDSVRALKEGDIQTVENRETLLLGERVIPAVRLGRLLNLDRSGNLARAEENIAVIARAGGISFALLVDEIQSEQEVLPKSLGKQLRRVRCITGATQLGDGTLVPILGLEDIARYGLLASDAAAQGEREPADVSQVKRVLVAEDSITSRLLLKHILESAGYQVETAVDGLEAVSKLRHQNFDALVSDIEMPGMDGLALTEHVRANPKTAELPVVLVTSLHSSAEKERGLRAGADAYVVKGSFDQDNLLVTIRRLI